MKTYVVLALAFVGLASMASANQPQDEAFTSDERLSGYAIRGDTTWFLFDPAVHGISAPRRVVLTGSHRGWNQDMEDAAWHLQLAENRNLWVLRVENPQFVKIPPSSPFKFRIDDGEWMQPADGAPNREAGNLIYAPGIAPIRLHAEVRTGNTLWVRLTGDGAQRSLEPKDYRLMTDDGREIPISQILPNTATESLLCLNEEIDPRRVFYLEYPQYQLKALCKRDGWYRTMYSPKPLGAEISADGGSTTFRVFAPRADRIGLYLYRNSEDRPIDAMKTIDMVKQPHGIWEAKIPGDLHGVYYDMTVHGPLERGNKFYESHRVHVTDPYARVSLDSFGKARVWRATRPAKPLAKGRPAMQNVIAYEVHVQDFTSELPVPDELRGTFPAMTVRGLTNAHGEPIGFDHLVRLGINVVHLMPVQEFLHYPDEEWQAAFRDDPFMKQQGVDRENYDWGYRTTHAFAIESRFRKRGSEHGAEREQLRDLVEAFHEQGIAVIVDIVPNHTGENMDGRNYLFNFGAIDTDYYYRTNDQLEHIGPYGNEVKFEERPMVQRWLVDQCRALIDEIGIDGFRIDLAGQIDKQTLIKLRQELGQDVLIYGEPWIAPSDLEVARSPDWGWYKKDAPITFFQDDARNAFKGPVSDPVDKKTSRGFAGGNASMREQAMRGLLNDFEEEAHPNMGINYLDIHDNWALADQFARRDWDGRFGVDQGPVRIAAGLLMTSLGPIVLHGGTEFLRSKGAAGSEERTQRTASGALAFHGKRDTYNVKTPNLFVWDNVGRPPVPETGECDYRKMQAYWTGLIAMRASREGEVFRVAAKPPEGYYRWILPSDAHLLGYVVANQFLVLVNASDEPASFPSMALERGVWRLISDGESVDHVQGVTGSDATLTGGQRMALTVPAQCMKIWLRRKE